MAKWMDQSARQNSMGYPVCEIQWDRECYGVAVEGHEPLTRARGGSVLDRTNVLLTCRRCHNNVHAHPEEALERGFLRSSWSA